MMEIVRKYLTPDEITPPNVRIDDPEGVAQMTPDGGETWIDVLAIDPRHSDALRLPALVGDVRCNVAARMVAQWKDTLDGFVLTTDAANAVQFLLTLIVALTGGVGLLVWIVWAVVESLILIGRENIVSAFTEEVWDGILCIIACSIDENGQMSAEQNADIMGQIAAAYPGTVYNTLVQLNNWYGEVLLSNAGVVRSEVGDCSDCACGWCRTYDFTTGAHGWAQAECYDTFCELSPGVGWVASFGGQIILRIDFALATTVTQAVVWCSQNLDGNLKSGYATRTGSICAGGSNVLEFAINMPTAPHTFAPDFTDDVTHDYFEIGFQNGTPNVDYPWAGNIYRIDLYGVGEAPTENGEGC